MRVLEVFHQRIPPKIKTSAKKVRILDWLMVWLCNNPCRHPKFHQHRKNWDALIQKQFAVTRPNPLHQFPLSSDISTFHSVLTPGHLPTCRDAQHASLRSRWQASFLLEGITESSSSNLGCMEDLTTSPNPVCPAFLCFLFPCMPRLLFFGEGTVFHSDSQLCSDTHPNRTQN